MKKYLIILFMAILPALLNANGLIVKSSNHSVDETVAKIEAIVKSKAKEGMGVFTIIDHQKGAKKTGQEMPAEKVILFGNPKLGTKMMQRDPKTGLDLPLKVLVYQDKEGKTKMVYHDPIVWSKDFDLEGCKLLKKMADVLDMITTKAGE
jgi:uncharacterized protein (DUF302 family)